MSGQRHFVEVRLKRFLLLQQSLEADFDPINFLSGVNTVHR